MTPRHKLIAWLGPADTPSGRTGQKFKVGDAGHVQTLFEQLGTADVALLVERAGRWLRKRASARRVWSRGLDSR